jgi:putative copper export protein
VLVLKVLIFGAVLFLGYTNWERETPRLETNGDPAFIRRSIRSELLATVAVLVATAMLLSTPTPSE